MDVKLRTHYDNLHITENASQEVVKAAYKALAQKWHPDKNPENRERAERVFKIITRAFEVLSNPSSREEYDAWLKQQREPKSTKEDSVKTPPPPSETAQFEEARRDGARSYQQGFKKSDCPYKDHLKSAWLQGYASAEYLRPRQKNTAHIRRFWPLYAIALIFVYANLSSRYDKPSQPQQVRPSAPAYSRPATAPNGTVWPTTAAHMSGYPILNNSGLSELTIDNTRNNSDVFIKVCNLQGSAYFPVRHIYLPAHSTFKTASLTPGTYDIRYKDLNTGGISKSSSFALTETATLNGTQYTKMSITIYKVPNGNMQSSRIDESQF